MRLTNSLTLARTHLLDSAATKQRTSETCLSSIVTAADLIGRAFQVGGKLLICGNGGSAADCQHMAAEFVSRLSKEFERPGLPAIALTTDSSFLTAFANDCGYDGVFERQVQALGRAGDVLMGISTSGNSRNVIRAVIAARLSGMRTIVLTGEGGLLAGLADIAISVPSTDTQHIQESHLAIEHIVCALVEQNLFAERALGEADTRHKPNETAAVVCDAHAQAQSQAVDSFSSNSGRQSSDN